MSFESVLAASDTEAAATQKQALTRAATLSVDTDPDKYAANRKKAVAVGMPAALANPAKKPATADDLHARIVAYHELQTTAPKTADFMTNPDNAKLAHDDHPVLSKLEGVLNIFKGAGARMAQGVNSAAGAVDEAFGLDQGAELYRQGANYWDKVATDAGSTGLAAKVYQGIGAAPQGVAEFVAGVPYAAAKGAAEGYKKNGIKGLVTGALTETVKRYGIGKVFSGIEASAMPAVKKSLTMAGTMGAQTAAEGGDLQDVIASTVTGLTLMPPKAGSHGESIRSALVKKGVDAKIAEEIGTHVDGVTAHANAEKIQDVVDVAKDSKLKARDPETFKTFVKSATEDSPPVSMPVEKLDGMLAAEGLQLADVMEDPTPYYEARVEGEDKVEIPAADLAGVAEHITPEHIKDMSVDGAPSVNEVAQKAEEAKPGEPAQEVAETKGAGQGRAQQKGEVTQPWEMTLDDFRDLQGGVRSKKGGVLAGNYDFKMPDGSTREYANTNYKKEGAIRDFHRKEIENAVQLGKPIPPEVLADYPDLQKLAEGNIEMAGHPANPVKAFSENNSTQGALAEQSTMIRPAVRVGETEEGGSAEAQALKAMREGRVAMSSNGKTFMIGEPGEGGRNPKNLKKAPWDKEIRDKHPNFKSLYDAAKAEPEGEKILTGADGDRHTDIVKDAPEESRGFQTPDGSFIGRKEAAGWLKENRPDLFAKLSDQAKEALHSEDLWKAVDDATVKTGIKNAATDADLEARGLSPIELEMKRGDSEVFETATAKLAAEPSYGKTLAKGIAENPRALTAEEVHALTIHKMKLMNEERSLLDAKAAAEKAGDADKSSQVGKQLKGVMEDLDTVFEASRKSGYESGLGFRARQMMVKEDYSFARNLARAVDANKGKELAPEAAAQIEELTRQLNEATDKLTAYEESASKDQAEHVVKKIKRDMAADIRKSNRADVKKILDGEFDELAKKLNSIISPNKLNAGVDPAAIPVLLEMARNRIRKGVVNASEIVDAVHEKVKDVLEGVTKREVRDAISGYGKTSKLSKNEIKVALRETKRQLRLISALEDAVRGETPLKSGMERDAVSDEVRNLRNKVKQAMKESGIDSKSAMSPEEQWKTSLDAAKTRLRNDITDLDRQIETGKRDPVKKTGIQYDDEAMELKTQRDIKKELLDTIDALPGITDQRRIEIAVQSLERSIEDYKRQIASGDVDGKKQVARGPQTPQILKLTEERDALRKERDEKRALKLEMKKQGVPDEDPQITALNRFMEKTKRAIDTKEKALKRSISKYQELISGRNLKPAKKLSATPETPEMARDKPILKALQDTYEQMKKDAEPPKDPEASRIKAYKTRVTKRVAEMEEQLRTGDFSKKAKRPAIELDAEGSALKEKQDRLKIQVDQVVESQRLANRSPGERTADGIKSWRRFVLLFGVKVLGKLTIAAGSRFGITPMEGMLGNILELAPPLRKIGEIAHREGGGFNISAEAKSLSQLWENKSFEDMASIWKTGLGELDVLYGDHKYASSPELLNSMGRIHSILKVMPKRAEFYRSMQIIAESYAREGHDLNDPKTQAMVAAESYVEANRAILMNDNLIVSAYKAFLGTFKRADNKGASAFALAVETEFPIIKVATNFADEVLSYTAGGLRSIPGLTKAALKGIDALSPKEADFILRNLKKNSLSALMASAVFSGALGLTFGGYYTRGEKRDPADLGPGEWAINGKKMPGFASHIPLLESMQVYQTVKNAYQAAKFKGQGEASSIAGGVGQAAYGMMEHIPFVGTTSRDLVAFETPEGRQKYFTNLAISLILPPDVGALARTMDNDTPRAPTTAAESLKNVVPGMRGDVPLNERKIHQEIISAKRHDKELNGYQQETFDRLTDQQKANIEKEAAMTPFQVAFSHMQDPTLEKSIKVWAKASDAEREELRDLYETRINLHMLQSNLDDEEHAKLEERIQNAEDRR